jgi:hypothetical protein
MDSLSVTAQMKQIVGNYNREVQEAVNEAAIESSESCLQQLKNTSPKRPKGGRYARGWAIKKNHTATGAVEYVVYNRTDYQLTHLLENGHVIRNKKGTYGRTRPIKHIAPAADTAIQRFDLSARARIGRIR